MNKEIFVNGYLSMLTEAFESPPEPWSAFLDQRTGLFETLASVSAETASAPPAPGHNTVAAHAEHLRFHLAGINAFLRGQEEKLDWTESWKVQQVDPAQWRGLQDALNEEYEAVRTFVREQPEWDEQAVGGAIGLLAHVAYHLGAIRQLVPLMQTRNGARP